MKYLVTGASGYIGSHLIKKMSEKGMSTRALVRRTSNTKGLSELKNIEICYGNVRDISSLEKAVKGCDMVFHLAACVEDWGAYRTFYEVNYLGTKNILHASIEAKVNKFIYISSVGVLDLSKRGVIYEDHPYGHFSGYYCRSKAKAEKLIRKSSDLISTLIIRAPAVYGPEDLLFTWKALYLARKHLLFVIDRGKGIFPYIYIDNLVEAILLASHKEMAAGEIFNLADGTNTTVGEFFNHFNHLVGKGNIRLSLPYPIAWKLALLLDIFNKLTGKPPLLSWTALEFLTLRCHFDVSKAKKALGYEPSVSLKEGMARVKAWWEEEIKKRGQKRNRN
ncbi:MAG: NAD-dependent epimerase/dehydratase family protein [Candidatus Aminicenantes bacterium]|nr:NAD-dependent epimerase/dehydratase family protein [Candidatus Aminicenantes bacterium]